jgi:hypothetical protein
MSGMTTAERLDLGKLVRLKAKVAKDDAEARGKELIADGESKLAAIYKEEDEAWADITEAAQKYAAKADAAIHALCCERGIPEEFRPSLRFVFFGRGENACKERRAELRKVLYAVVAALVKKAQVEIDRQAVQQMTEITRAGLSSEEAVAFLANMPTPEQLMPPIATLELRNGQVVALKSPTPVTEVTDNGAANVTDNGETVTPGRPVCAFCGKPFTPSRRDSKYCRPACRVADWRQRLREAEDREYDW